MRCSADESTFTPSFQRHPIQDTRGVLEHNDTLYVLFDGPCRVFLHTEHKSRIFCNVWLLNGFLIFRGWRHATVSYDFLSEVFPDSSGVLEGEKLVRVSSAPHTRYILREQPVVHYDSDSDSGSRLNHTHLPPIVITPLANLSLDEAFEDWTALSRSASHSMDMHVYSLRASHESVRSVVCFCASKSSDTSCERLHRTYLHLLQHPLVINTVCYTQPSICWRMIYSWEYSTATDWVTRMVGMSDLGGANSLMFVEDGATSYTLRYST